MRILLGSLVVAAVTAGCTTAESQRPARVDVPHEALDMLVFVQPEIRWIGPPYTSVGRQWGKEFMKALALELTAQGFILVADEQQKHELAIGVSLDEGAGESTPVKASLHLRGTRGPSEFKTVSLDCENAKYAARVLANQLVRSGYIEKVVDYRTVPLEAAPSPLL